MIPSDEGVKEAREMLEKPYDVAWSMRWEEFSKSYNPEDYIGSVFYVWAPRIPYGGWDDGKKDEHAPAPYALFPKDRKRGVDFLRKCKEKADERNPSRRNPVL